MMPVKIECECGQHYSFDVEPVNGQMPAAVACPECGADGTATANDFISQQLAVQTVATESAPQPARLVTTRPTLSAESSGAKPANFAKAEQQARAKIMLGDSMEQVAAFLSVQGLGRDEAAVVARKFYQERVAIVRSNGIKKIIIGIVLACVPAAAYFFFRYAERIWVRLALVSYGVGILGLYLLVTGILSVVNPKSERGAVQKE